MARSLPDQVRAAAAAVMARSSWVHIAAERLGPYARSLPLARLDEPSPDPAHQALSSPEATAGYVLLVGTLNFGSGYFPSLVLPPGQSGYMMMAQALRRWVAEDGLPSARRLARIEAAECAALFGQPPDGGPRTELMGRFAAALHELGQLLEERYGGSPVALIRSARHRAALLVRRLSELPSFRDVQLHAGRPVPFYKRAQLLAADLHRALGGRGLGRFDDVDRLTAFADNAVPHVLRLDGVIALHPDLARRIDSGQELASGSAEEVELRAGAVEACERLVAELGRQGRPLPAWRLDFLLWLRGESPAYQAPPPHRTRSVFY